MSQIIKNYEIKSIDDYRVKMKEVGYSSKDIEEFITVALRCLSSEEEILSLLNDCYYVATHAPIAD